MSGLLRASQAYIVFWFGISQALRDNPKNCSGYCTRALTSRQAGIFRLEIPSAWEDTEQLFGILGEDQVENTWTSASPASLITCWVSRCLGNKQNNCSGYAQAQVLGIFINFFIFLC